MVSQSASGRAAGADAERCLREAVAAAARHHQDHGPVRIDADAPAGGGAIGQPGVDTQAAGKARARAHRRIPLRLCQRHRERRQQAGGAVVGGPVAGIATVAVLEHLHVRHAADARQLRHFRGDVADHQGGIGAVEPGHHRRHRAPDRRPAERGAVQRRRRRHVIERRRLVAARLEQRRDPHDTGIRRQIRKDVVARAEHGERPARRERVRDGGAAFRVPPALVMHEIAERPHHAAAARLDDCAPGRRNDS